MCVPAGHRLNYKVLSSSIILSDRKVRNLWNCELPNPPCVVVAPFKNQISLRNTWIGNTLNFFLSALGFVPRKREEENKRREAEQQKGRLSPDSCRPHAPLCLPRTQAEPHRQSRAPSKQPPCSDKAQGPERKACRRSPGRGSPSRAPQKEQQLSSDLQRTEPRKPNGKCIALRFSANPWTVGSFVSYYLYHLHLR